MTAQTNRIRDLREANEDALHTRADNIRSQLANVRGRTHASADLPEDAAATARSLELERTTCHKALLATARTLPWTLTEFLG